MVRRSTADILCSGIFLAISVLLIGCDFGTSQPRADCSGEACDCKLAYYGMDAKIYLDGIPVEHASLYVTIPRVEPDTENITGCCDQMYGLVPVNYFQAHSAPIFEPEMFCEKCRRAPSAYVNQSAKQACSSSAPVNDLQIPRSAARTTTTELQDAPMDGSDKYFDCSVEFGTSEANVLLPANVLASGASSIFNLKWTDRNDNSEKPCCAALRPVLQSLFLKGTAPAISEKQQFCDACSSAYNTGVALAAYRWCEDAEVIAAASVQAPEDKRTVSVV